ncbi:MAG: hypothetical protein ACTSXC_04730 [Candidatus Freyarchaeota archaeon]
MTLYRLLVTWTRDSDDIHRTPIYIRRVEDRLAFLRSYERGREITRGEGWVLFKLTNKPKRVFCRTKHLSLGMLSVLVHRFIKSKAGELISYFLEPVEG